jgi:hypothetical protein
VGAQANPSQPGFPLPQSAVGDVKERKRRSKRRGGVHPWEHIVFAEPKPSGREEPDRAAAHTFFLSFPYQRRRLPLHHVDPLFTDVCASARGHQGENELPRSSVDAPAFEPRGKPTFATAPPCPPL